MEKLPHGEWTDIRLNYLREEQPELLAQLRESGELANHLQELDDRYNDKLIEMLERQMEREGVDEEMKSKDPMAWVGRMNNIRAQVKEILIAEICSGSLIASAAD